MHSILLDINTMMQSLPSRKTVSSTSSGSTATVEYPYSKSQAALTGRAREFRSTESMASTHQ
jgi:hypothetical protein